MDKRPKLVIIDGSSLLYRAFFALPPLNTAEGTPTNAVYGYTTMLLKALEEEKPDVVLVAWEGGKTFRHTEFADYKAHRPPTPVELKTQGPLAREITEAFRIPMLSVQGYEADDVLGCLAFKAPDAGYEVLIVTGDLDALQLCAPHVKVLVNRRGITDTHLYDEAGVIERYGLPPKRLPEFKALKGDSSDNIPGIAGIGDKTATTLLQQYPSLEELVAHAEEIAAPRIRTNLLEGRENVILYKRLATIVCDLPMELPFAEWHWPGPDVPRVVDLCNKLEFRTLARRIVALFPSEEAQSAPSESVNISGEWKQVIHEDDLQSWLSHRKAEESVIVHTLQTGSGGRGILIRGTALAASGAMTLVLGADTEEGEGLLAAAADPWQPPPTLANWLSDQTVRLAGHDLKRDLHALAAAGVNVEATPVFDTMLAAYVLNPGRSTYRLEDIARAFVGETLSGAAHDPAGLAHEAAVITALIPVLARKLEEEDLNRVFYELEMPLVPILREMEACGVAVNREELNALSGRLAQRIATLEKQAADIVGRPVALGSPKQLQDLLFTELGLPAGRKTKTGYSTDSDVLQDLAVIHPLPEVILQWRELTKLKSTYADSLQNLIDPRTGRIHTRLNQAVAATGRLSSSDPNLQNIPIRTEVGREIRAAFVPAEGMTLLAADYSQIELRIAAHCSGDPELVRAFAENRDVHTATAARVYDVPVSEVTSEQRRNAKTVNFAVLYGQREFGLSRQLRIDIADARRLITAYFEEFPGIRQFMDRTLDNARRNGFVETLPPYRRKRYIPAIHSGNRVERMAAEREAGNAPVQGAASDIIKAAMIAVHKSMKEQALKSRMILQVHDELLFEVAPGEEDTMCRLVRKEMETAAELSVPLVVDVKLGKNWRDTTPIDRDPSGPAQLSLL